MATAVTDMAVHSGKMDVEAFTRDTILRFLKERGFRYLVDTDGDYFIAFGYTDELGCQLNVLLAASGTSDEIYVVRVMSDRRIQKGEWGKAVMLCNTWNRDHRWPKAFLLVRDPDSDEFGAIHLEEQIDLEKGVHQELFNDFTDTTIMAAHAFWSWAHGEQGL